MANTPTANITSARSCRYRARTPCACTAASSLHSRERRLDGRLRRPRHRHEDSLAERRGDPPPPPPRNSSPHRAANPTASHDHA